jgi:hypothetical protein
MEQNEIDQKKFHFETEVEILGLCSSMLSFFNFFRKYSKKIQNPFKYPNNPYIVFFLGLCVILVVPEVLDFCIGIIILCSVFFLLLCCMAFRICYVVVKSRIWFLYNASEKYFKNKKKRCNINVAMH